MPKTKSAHKSNEGFDYVIKLDGLPDPNRYVTSFGEQVTYRKVVKAFREDPKTKTGYVRMKRRTGSFINAVKKELKELGATQYYGSWKTPTATYRDDVVEFQYQTEAE